MELIPFNVEGLSVSFDDVLDKMDELHDLASRLNANGYFDKSKHSIFVFSFTLSKNIMVGPVDLVFQVMSDEYIVRCSNDANKTIRSVFFLRETIADVLHEVEHDELRDILNKKIEGEFRIHLVVDENRVEYLVFANKKEFIIDVKIPTKEPKRRIAEMIIPGAIVDAFKETIDRLMHRIDVLEEKLADISILDEDCSPLGVDELNEDVLEAAFSVDVEEGTFTLCSKTINDEFLIDLQQRLVLTDGEVFPMSFEIDADKFMVTEDGKMFNGECYIGNLVDYLYLSKDDIYLMTNFPAVSRWIVGQIKKGGR